MKFKWNKGLLFPYLMLIGSASISVQTVQTENNNNLVLINKQINTFDKDNNNPPVEKQETISVALIEEKSTEINYNTSLQEQSKKLHLIQLSVLLVLLSLSFAYKQDNENYLSSLFNLSTNHMHYLRYWNFQYFLSKEITLSYKKSFLNFIENNSLNNVGLNVSTLHNVTSH